MSSGSGDERPPSGDAELTRVWDESYYAHVFVTADEYEHRAIARADGDFLVLDDGTRSARLHERPPLHERRASQRAHPRRDRGGARPLRVRMGRLGDGLPLPRREADRRRPAGPDDWAGRIRFTSSGSEAIELALLIAKTRHRPTERHLPRLRLPRLDARRALADGTPRLAGHPRRGRLRRGPAPGRASRCRACTSHLRPTASTARSGTPIPACKRGDDTLACIAATRAPDPHARARLDRRGRCRADLRRRHVPSASPSTCRSCAS